jgi:hypothetical protein
MRMRNIIYSLAIYIIIFATLIMIGFVGWFIARGLAIHTLHLPNYLDRATYSFFEATFVVMIYFLSFCLSFPLTNRSKNFLKRFAK